MADIAKWALLVAGIIGIIALIMALPIMDALDATPLIGSINGLIGVAGSFFVSARGIINNFLTPAGAEVLNVCILWIVCKFLLTWTIKMTVGIYRFIFK